MLSQIEIDKKLRDWPLSWIDKDTLISLVQSLLDEAKPKNQNLDHKNVVDPFSAIFDLALSNMDYPTWVSSEIRRQHQKTMQNAIGKLHQTVLGKVAGWEDMGVGNVIDLINKEKKIFAEVKNKFNTVKASDRIGVYETMTQWRGLIPEHRSYTGYYVQVIAKEKFDRPFTPSDNKTGIRAASSEHIREIDGESFYTLVTGSATALADFYSILPYVLQKVLPSFDAEKAVKDPLFKDLFNRACCHKN